MNRLLILFFSLCFAISGYSQSRKKEQEVDIIDHQVQFGETVRMISKKYLVDPAEIYKLNKFAVEGISQGMTLKIPVPRKEGAPKKEVESARQEEVVAQNDSSNEQTVQETKTEDAKPKETRKPQPVNPEPVKESNDDAIVNSSATSSQPKNKEVKKIVITETQTDINHKVIAKETLYSLSRDFNVSVDEIKAANPELANKGLQIGQIVKIPKGKTVDIQQSTVEGTPVISNKTVVEKPVSTPSTESKNNNSTAVSETITHKVEPKETLYSLSRKYNVPVEEIKSQNEALLKNGLQIGQILTIKK
ncbi:MAG: LysM peptidoglycan-binding domain-containing protein [Flavobacteriaceae bacterium]